MRIAQDNGIGEALPTSIEKDGTGKGPDLELIEFVGKHVKVPIIYGGGIASIKHIDAVISGNHASGVALASYLHVDGTSVTDIKSTLELSGHLMRQDITL